MEYLNNHFIPNISVPEYRTYEIVPDGIVGAFSETYIAGMYIVIKHSLVNDGLYKIASVTSTKITVEETLLAENTGEYILIVGSSPPKSFVNLATEIGNFKESVGVASESIDDYSVSFDKGGTWQQAYSSKLSHYRNLFSDLPEWA